MLSGLLAHEAYVERDLRRLARKSKVPRKQASKEGGS